MPLFFQQHIDANTRLAVWKIEEDEEFFLAKVPLQREITHPHKRLQHLAGRYLLPYLFPDFPHHDIEIASTRKPFLASEQYHFSISHCSDYAAAIVSSRARVGVDVEVVTPRVEKIRHKFLHAEELSSFDLLSYQPTTANQQLLTLLWSAKEAMYKWYGLGEVDFSMMMRTQSFTVANSGVFGGLFLKEDLRQELKLEYKLWEKLSLVWVVSE